jgi:general bacterial porin, GBP family
MEIHMKKSLLALAVLSAVAGVASAQSSVTLYGLVDIGLGRLDPKAAGVANTTGVVSGIQSGSRVGLRGSEDLGGGLKAIFNLEHGFSADDGTQGQGRMWGRWAWAGVEGSFGQVRLGRQWAAGFELFGAVDPWGTGFNDAGSQSVFASANAIRVNNALVYRSPIVGGFGAVVGYSFNPLGQEVPGSSDLNNRTWTAGFRFGAGPFLGVATYERVAFAAADQQHIQLGATFDAKVVKVHAMFGQEKDQQALGPRLFGLTGVGNDATSWMAGVTVPLGSANLIASYANRDVDNPVTTGPLAGQRTDGRVIALGGTYSLSRRTNTYLMYSDSDAKGVINAWDRKELVAGVRHTF